MGSRDGAREMLQWGRDVSVAEVWVKSTLGRFRQLCFNGAATFPSRKSTKTFPLGKLAIGFNGAATFPSRKFSAHRLRE